MTTAEYRVNASGALTRAQLDAFAGSGILELGQVLRGAELEHYQRLFERNRVEHERYWKDGVYVYQRSNYDAVFTQPEWDGLVRHPGVLPIVEGLMGAPVCLGENSLREMGPTGLDHPGHTDWHRDGPGMRDGPGTHPLHLRFIQMMVYLSDVDEDTHCISFAPESLRDLPGHAEQLDEEQQLQRSGGPRHLHGRAGTIALFSSATVHTVTTRPTLSTRKSVQIYYGFAHERPMSHDYDSLLPPAFWRDAPDLETRRFYGNLNDRTRDYVRSGSVPIGNERPISGPDYGDSAPPPSASVAAAARL
jgi:hypothetical protein